MRTLLVLSLLGLWGYAIACYGELPDRIPMHFGISGEPDRWADKSIWSWFVLPALGTVLGVTMGFLLPQWIVGLARRNSALLNMPDAARFRALPEPARVRCVLPLQPGLRAIGLIVVLLMWTAVHGMAQVALGIWRSPPMWPTLVLVASMLLVTVWMAVASSRRVRSEAGAG